MKFSKLALTCAMASLLTAGSAIAQSPVRQPDSVQRTAFEYSSYYAQEESPPSPGDKTPASPDAPVAPPAGPADPAAAGGCGCQSDCCGGCDDCCGGGLVDRWLTLGGLIDPCCKLGEACKLFDKECLKCKHITVAGYIAHGFTGNLNSPVDRFNGPVTFIDRSNEYLVNQLYFYIERPTDTQGCGWDFGYRADLMYGSDARFTTASGLETRQQFQSPKWSTARFYGPAAPQFYGEAAYDDWKVKVGHFYAPVGYEVVTTNANFFDSVPYTFQYGEPFTYTGALATLKLGDELSVFSGVERGWDNFGNNNPNLGYIGGFTRTYCDKSILAWAVTWSNEPNQTTNLALGNNAHSSRVLTTTAYTKPLDEKVTWVAQSDWGYQDHALANGRRAQWYGLNNYLFYKVSDCFSWGVRGEWFRDEEGFRVGGFLGTTPDGELRGLDTARSGYAGSFYEVTFGAQYKPNANTTIRPMVRFDWYSGAVNNAGGLKPFDDGNKDHQVLVGWDAVTTF